MDRSATRHLLRRKLRIRIAAGAFLTLRLLLGPLILREATLVPLVHPQPIPQEGFGSIHRLSLVPVPGEPSRGGTSRWGTSLAQMGKEGNGGKCVCRRGESLQVPVSLCQTSSHIQMSA